MTNRTSSIWPTSSASDRDEAFGADHDLRGVLGDDKGRLEEKTVLVDHLAVGIHVPVARPGEGYFAVGEEDLVKSVSLDGDVEGLFGYLEVALAHEAGGSHNTGSKADLHAVGYHGGRFHGCAWFPVDLVQKIGEIRPFSFESGGVHVGEVVGRDVQVGLLGDHSACACPQGSEHIFLPPASWSCRRT